MQPAELMESPAMDHIVLVCFIGDFLKWVDTVILPITCKNGRQLRVSNQSVRFFPFRITTIVVLACF